MGDSKNPVQRKTRTLARRAASALPLLLIAAAEAACSASGSAQSNDIELGETSQAIAWPSTNTGAAPWNSSGLYTNPNQQPASRDHRICVTRNDGYVFGCRLPGDGPNDIYFCSWDTFTPEQYMWTRTDGSKFFPQNDVQAYAEYGCVPSAADPSTCETYYYPRYTYFKGWGYCDGGGSEKNSCIPSPNSCLTGTMCIPNGGSRDNLTGNDISALNGTNTHTIGCLSLGGAGKPVTVGLMSSTLLWASKLGLGGLPRGWTMNYTRALSIGTAPPSLYALGADAATLAKAAGPLVYVSYPGGNSPSVTTYDIAYLTVETGEVLMFTRRQGSGDPYYYPVGGSISTSDKRLDVSGAVKVIEYRNGTREEFIPAASSYALPGGWDTSYKLSSQSDLNAGDKISIDYTVGGKRTIRNDRTGQKLTVTLDGSGRPTSVADDAGNVAGTAPPPTRTVGVTYFASGAGGTPSGPLAGQVQRVTDAAGATETYEYDTVGRLAKECDKNAKCATTVYANPAPAAGQNVVSRSIGSFLYQVPYTASTPLPGSEKATSQTAPDGTVTTFTWAVTYGVDLTVSRASGGQSATERFLHYPSGAVRRVYARDSSTAYSEAILDDQGNTVSTKDPEGRETRYGYSWQGVMTSVTDPAGLTTTYTVNDYGQPTKITDPQGRVTDMTYCYGSPLPAGCGALGALRSIVDRGADGAGANDRTTTFETNAAGQVTAAVMPDGTRNEVTYDALGYPAQSIANKGTTQLVSTTSYNWRGDLVSATDPRGVTSTQAYDNMGRVTSKVSAVGTSLQSTTKFKYDGMGNLIRLLEDEGGANRRTEIVYANPNYKGTYLPTTVREGMGGGDINSAWSGATRTSSSTYRMGGEPSSSTDPLGRVTTMAYAYNADGTATMTTTPPGRGAVTRVTEMNKAGQPVSSVDERGVKTSYGYDTAGRPITVTSGSQTTGAIPVTYTTTYDAQGRVSSVAGPSGYTQVPTYDTFGRVASQVESGLRWTSSTFDVMDRVVTSKAGNGAVANTNVEATMAMTYDGLGRVTTQTSNPGGLNLQTQYVYVEGSESDKVNLRRVIDPKGNITRYSYNAQGALAQTTDANGGVFTYTYDKLGRMILQSSPGNSQSFGYDVLDRRTSASMNSGSAFPETWRYNADNNISSYCPPAGGAACVSSPTSANGAWVYSYDPAGRMAGIDYPEVAGVTSADATYTYLANDLLASVTDANGKTAYTYDALNRVVVRARCSVLGCTPDVASDATANNKRLVYAYKANDTALSSLQYWNRGSVSYTTNALGQVTQLTDWAGNPTTYTYSGTGQLATANVNAGTAFTSTYAYDTARRLSRITHAKGAANLLDLRYDGFAGGETDFAGAQLAGRDANGNVRGIKETWGTEASLTHAFGYDPLNRLTGIKHAALPAGPWGSTAAPAINVTNAYDARGNATSFMGKTFAYDTADRLTTSGFAFSPNGNMVESPGTQGGASITTAKSTYAYRENIVAAYSGLPASGYVVLAAPGSALGAHVGFYCATAGASGSCTFDLASANIPPGTYEVRAVAPWATTLAAMKTITIQEAVGTEAVTTNKPTYAYRENIIANYTGLAGYAGNVVLSAPGSAVASHVGFYCPVPAGTLSGTCTMNMAAANIAPGTYEVRVVTPWPTTLAAVQTITIQEAAGTDTITTNKATYAYRENIVASYSGLAGYAGYVLLSTPGTALSANVGFYCPIPSGTLSGTCTLNLAAANIEPGVYDVRVVAPWATNLAAARQVTIQPVPGPVVLTTDKTSYVGGETVNVSVSGLPGSSGWITLAQPAWSLGSAAKCSFAAGTLSKTCAIATSAGTTGTWQVRVVTPWASTLVASEDITF